MLKLTIFSIQSLLVLIKIIIFAQFFNVTLYKLNT